jgi:hypothetical protein
MKNIPLPLILGAVAVGGYILLTRDNKEKANDPTPIPTPTPTPPIDPDIDYESLVQEVNNVKSLAETNTTELSGVKSLAQSNNDSLGSKADATALASYTPVTDFNTYKTNTNSTLGGKANQSSLNNLQSDVSSKASTTYVNNQLGGKLDSSAADDFASATELQTYKSSTDSALSGKANQAALNSFQTQTSGFFTDYGNQLSYIDSELSSKASYNDVDDEVNQLSQNIANQGYATANYVANQVNPLSGLITNNISNIDAISQDVDGFEVGLNSVLDLANANSNLILENQAEISNRVPQDTFDDAIGGITNYLDNQNAVLLDSSSATPRPFSGSTRTYRNNTFTFDGSVDHKRGVGQIGFTPNAW